ncbi:TIGR01548 family HAD-type hydrolase [Synechococcus sp. N19]|uniref:TIGR01548 family HAD-type hydrolase n=1 Tax=Synechococcus sp. N19 TaxID=2575512 RepID=UPI000E0EECB4|nr:TIGR01548 family HAD-type hydrolase [Synechococcus sp. N19]
MDVLGSLTILLFDIDGVIRDVAGSYRRALQCTVQHYCGWQPSADVIDALKAEGAWNNDWDASLELLRRHGAELPDRAALIDVFSGFYFGGDPDGDPSQWTGFIGDEPLLVDASFFTTLSKRELRWGFVSGAEPPSARFVLQQRLGLQDPPLIAMGDAPDKPDPTGLIRLAKALGASAEGVQVAYLGDTVADVHTVIQARERWPEQPFVSLAVAPPHLQTPEQAAARDIYEQRLREAGADQVLTTTEAVLQWEGAAG